MTASRRDTLVHGVVAGIIGYVMVAVLFALLNLLAGRPVFATAAQLGAGLLGRGVVAPAVPLDPAPVFAFNGAHLLVMIAMGMVASALTTAWETWPRAGFLPFFAFVAGSIAVLLGSVAVFTGLLRTLPPLEIVAANVLGVVVVGWYLLASHPYLRSHWADFGEE